MKKKKKREEIALDNKGGRKGRENSKKKDLQPLYMSVTALARHAFVIGSRVQADERRRRGRRRERRTVTRDCKLVTPPLYIARSHHPLFFLVSSRIHTRPPTQRPFPPCIDSLQTRSE
jgi:hypothetical protein